MSRAAENDAPHESDAEAADDATPDDLAAALREYINLSPVEREFYRLDFAKRFKVRTNWLDKQVKELDATDFGSGSAVRFEEPDPWIEEVDGVALADELAALVKRFLMTDDFAITAIVLWSIHTYCFDAAENTPRLGFSSAIKRSGKSRGLAIVRRLANRPLSTSSTSIAALFRAIAKWHPTIIWDEADNSLRDDNSDANALLNTGHSREEDGVMRTVGDDHDVRVFDVHAPVAFACIGKLKDTMMDRSIIIRMRRKPQGAVIERLSPKANDLFIGARQRIVRWVNDNRRHIEDADPKIPKNLNDRACDNWRILLAIADQIGGEWPERARQAAMGLEAEGAGDAEDLLSQLLSDLYDIFRGVDFVPTLSEWGILAKLHKLDDRPWGELPPAGKPITEHRLGRMLKELEIKSGRQGSPPDQVRGYYADHFADAFRRYLGKE